MFAENLRHLRDGQKMSQQELAGKFNVAKQTIGSWESGRTTPDYAMLTRIANYFGVSTDYLLGHQLSANHSSFANLNEPPLSAEEKGLLTVFRSLPSEQRNAVIDLFRNLLRPLSDARSAVFREREVNV